MFEAADYEFTATVDDGARVYVDGVLIIDKWLDQAATKYSAVKTMTAGEHIIKVEYYQSTGPGSINFNWVKIAPSAPVCDQVGVNNFYGCYYDNIDLTNLKKIQAEPAGIHFNWGTTSPMPEIGVDTFSVRWQGKFTLVAGTYQFVVKTDDGVRVYIDGKLILDKWINQASTTYTITQVIGAGEHLIKMEYFENGGAADADLSWVLIDQPTQLTCDQIGQNIFVGCYYNDMFLTELKFTRVDQIINFNWKLDSPSALIDPNTFSAKWQGEFSFDNATYVFSTTADDGVRVYIDGVKIIDGWKNQVATKYTSTINLKAGKHIVMLEYYENGYDALVQLNWNKQ